MFSAIEVANAYGVTVRALVFYEKRGLLFPKRLGHVRYFRPVDQSRLELILMGRKIGFALSEIKLVIENAINMACEANSQTKCLTQSEIDRQLDVLAKRQTELRALIDKLRSASSIY